MKQLPELKGTGIRLYKQHTSSYKFVCFDCRLCFHKWAYWSDELEKHAPECLTCRKPMLFAGTAFRAPRKQDVKEWAKLEIMVRGGYKFHYYGGCGPIKHLTAQDMVKKVRKPRTTVDYIDDRKRVGLSVFMERRPGKGKRVPAKHWKGGDTYVA